MHHLSLSGKVNRGQQFDQSNEVIKDMTCNSHSTNKNFIIIQ